MSSSLVFASLAATVTALALLKSSSSPRCRSVERVEGESKEGEAVKEEGVETGNEVEEIQRSLSPSSQPSLPKDSLTTPGKRYSADNPWWIVTVKKWLETGVAPDMDPPVPALLTPPSEARLQFESIPQFGKQMRSHWFRVDPRTAYLNHG